MARQPDGAAHVALRRLKRVRDQAEISFPETESEPREARDVDFAAEAEETETACAKLRSKIAALAAAGESGSRRMAAQRQAELTAKVDAFRGRLKTLEADAEKAAERVTQAVAAAEAVADRGRALKSEVDQEIAAVEAKLGHDVRAQ